MSVRRGLLPCALAIVLGTSTLLLAACGGGGTKGGIPSASAGELKSQITDVGEAVDGGRCKEVPGQLRQVDQGIDQLPKTTDDQLVRALRDGADTLRRVAVDECDSDTNATKTTTTPAAPEETDTTESVPQDNAPTDTEPTETTDVPDTTVPDEPPPPPQTTPTPPPATPPPVNPTPPPPPAVTPGGGVTPEIPPG